MNDYNVIKTGNKTAWKDKDGKLVEADVYKFVKSFQTTCLTNKEELLNEKTLLQERLIEIDIILAEIEELDKT